MGTIEPTRAIAEAPSWLINLSNGSNGDGKKEPFDTEAALGGAEHGKRYYLLISLAGKLRHADVPFDVALELMNQCGDNCKPPAPREDVKKILKKAYESWQPGAEETKPDNPFTPQEYWQQYDVADIRTWQCPELEPIIEGILAKGNLCWLAAETQTGKTLFMLWVCLHLLYKGSLFDKFAITPVSRILYVACEDPARRFKARLLDMHPTAIEAGRFVVYVAPGLSIADDLCFQFLEQMIIDGGFDLVVIDTFQAATMGIGSFDDEKLSIVIRHLLNITRKLGTTVIVNDHFRKTQNHKKRADLDANDVKGSGGKLQNADVFLLMDRRDGKLRISGKSKEWDRPIGFLLDIAPQGSQNGSKFSYAGDFEQFASGSKKRGEETRKNIIEAMRGIEWISTREVAFKTKISEQTVRRHVSALVAEEIVLETGAGKLIRYQLVNQSQEST
jgi:hypothetical protein